MSEDELVDISGLDKAAVLATLYNGAAPQGMGYLQYDPQPMTTEEAQSILDKRRGCTYCDYMKGRLLKIDIAGDIINTRAYDEDNGEMAARRAILGLRETGNPDNYMTQMHHADAMSRSVRAVSRSMDQPSTHEVRDGMHVIELGLADMADVLAPAVKRAVSKTRWSFE